MRTITSILDRICPDESHLPPSARTWARIIRVPSCCGPILELRERDPASGVGADPGTKPRHQYQVARERLWRRVLPPAQLDAVSDGDSWEDRERYRWELAQPGCGLPWEWARARGVPLIYATKPVRMRPRFADEWQHADGTVSAVGFAMPPADPHDIWADVTGVRCPLCDQQLVWYEAGYVPGYRVCMRDGEPRTLRHRWLWRRGVLVLDGEYDLDGADLHAARRQS